jgi:hypothetical protein
MAKSRVGVSPESRLEDLLLKVLAELKEKSEDNNAKASRLARVCVKLSGLLSQLVELPPPPPVPEPPPVVDPEADKIAYGHQMRRMRRMR